MEEVTVGMDLEIDKQRETFQEILKRKEHGYVCRVVPSKVGRFRG